MNWFWSLTLSALFCFFGLTACTSDKVNRHEDTWRFPPPEIVVGGSGENQTARFDIAEATQRQLTAESELKFSETENVMLSVRSLCVRGDNKFDESFKFGAKASQSILNLLPSQVFLGANANSELTCSFEFLATNEHSSSQHFVLNGLKITGLGNYNNLQTAFRLQPLNAQTLTKISVGEINQIAVQNDSPEARAELICADFVSKNDLEPVEKVDLQKLAYNQTHEQQIKTLSHFRQRCRISLVDAEGLRSKISPEFELQFPTPQVSVETDVPQLTCDSIKTIPVLNVQIKNATEVDQYFAIPADGQVAANATALIGTRNLQSFSFNTKTDYSIFSSAVSGADTVNTTYRKYIILKAGTQASLTIYATNLYSLYIGKDWPTPPNLWNGGYLFAMQSPFRLERIYSPDDFNDTVDSRSFESFAILKMLSYQINEMKLFVPTPNVSNIPETEKSVSN